MKSLLCSFARIQRVLQIRWKCKCKCAINTADFINDRNNFSDVFKNKLHYLSKDSMITDIHCGVLLRNRIIMVKQVMTPREVFGGGGSRAFFHTVVGCFPNEFQNLQLFDSFRSWFGSAFSNSPEQRNFQEKWKWFTQKLAVASHRYAGWARMASTPLVWLLVGDPDLDSTLER